MLTDYFGLEDYADLKILEIGGGENGALKYFTERGATTYGLEISPARVDYAKEQLEGTGIQIMQGDIRKPSIIEKLPAMDLVILRDVIEHVDDKRAALVNIRKMLSKDGKLFVSFPPKYSAYAGHQQNIKGKFRKIPFLHLLPRPLYRGALSIVADTSDRIEALMETHSTMISIGAIERIFSEVSLTIRRKEYYLVRPAYEKRFGMKPRKTVLNKLPLTREVFSMGALYLLGQ